MTVPKSCNRTADQAKEGVSLDAQADRLRAYCQMRGLNLVEIVADEGVSGTTPFCDREGGRKVLAMVKAGMVTEIIGLKLDRLFRNAHDALGKLGEWDKAKVGLHLVDMGGAAVDTRSAMGRMMLTMLAGFAQFERDLISERTTAALQHKKKTSKPYGHTPLGFNKVEEGERSNGSKTYRLERNEDEAALVTRIKALKAEGKSLLGIATLLNGEGIKGKTGGRFYASTIKAILSNSADEDVGGEGQANSLDILPEPIAEPQVRRQPIQRRPTLDPAIIPEPPAARPVPSRRRLDL